MHKNVMPFLALSLLYLSACEKNLRDGEKDEHPHNPVFNLGIPKNALAVPGQEESKRIFLEAYPTYAPDGHTLFKVACVHGTNPLDTELRILCLHGARSYVSSFNSGNWLYHTLRGTLTEGCVMRGLGDQDIKQCIQVTSKNDDRWIEISEEVSGPEWEDFHGSEAERDLLKTRIDSLCVAPMNRPYRPLRDGFLKF